MREPGGQVRDHVVYISVSNILADPEIGGDLSVGVVLAQIYERDQGPLGGWQLTGGHPPG